jgi:hypothetical protein
VGQLESLETVASFGFLAHDIQNGIDQLGSLGVVALKVENVMSQQNLSASNEVTFAQLFPAPLWPKMKLSGRKS